MAKEKTKLAKMMLSQTSTAAIMKKHVDLKALEQKLKCGTQSNQEMALNRQMDAYIRFVKRFNNLVKKVIF